ncbi:undecaprenyldiphospho-muramoylpentapeptide beta-N-acetylglucosaminyltransferase [Leptolyngbya sp. NIES-2104]|uniref:undecaprenyldiphospho-muramoylpentapeptide beta-N-acetylglucosaminyltransferase n=1 Tax=Leptolyngbya sp. NIES-2104 TaxID=1552121 RepID=UPI0006ECCE0E|nr:undecaprenyldiphospho-muramoylpentapeptide beta-N-acetylglucosaminyltransferase [Leptolyngbya sp. NIES-2104]GAP98383.1 UDP-N-acetylglucosamine--N-acetylmuramyl-(pentapeptide) pyrophosphoryl-undecaprenol N-acetylglucosamine transferase [Leptolyngbya sp. NIES-2104]
MQSSLSSINKKRRLLIAASGTGGHVFPAIAVAEQLSDFEIEWLGVPDRLESQLIGDRYPIHYISVAGFQQKLGFGTFKVLSRLIRSIWNVRQILQKGRFEGVFTTGGYISAPAIIAARSLGLPVILHESNALPGKVTRFFAPWCTLVAIGFEMAAKSIPKAKTVVVGTPVRSQFRSALSEPLDLPIPEGVPLVVVVGGSQGAVAMNQLVRQAAPAWFEKGAWVVHLTGENDPEAKSLQHPQYLALPFYQDMAALFMRSNLAISRSGAGTVTELTVTGTPAILIPFPFAAEDHQAFNAKVMVNAGAAEMYRQSELSVEQLQKVVLELLENRDRLAMMSNQAKSIAIIDSAERTAQLVREAV